MPILMDSSSSFLPGLPSLGEFALDGGRDAGVGWGGGEGFAVGFCRFGWLALLEQGVAQVVPDPVGPRAVLGGEGASEGLLGLWEVACAQVEDAQAVERLEVVGSEVYSLLQGRLCFGEPLEVDEGLALLLPHPCVRGHRFEEGGQGVESLLAHFGGVVGLGQVDAGGCVGRPTGYVNGEEGLLGGAVVRGAAFREVAEGVVGLHEERASTAPVGMGAFDVALFKAVEGAVDEGG